jgi:hypothetical protein
MSSAASGMASADVSRGAADMTFAYRRAMEGTASGEAVPRTVMMMVIVAAAGIAPTAIINAAIIAGVTVVIAHVTAIVVTAAWSDRDTAGQTDRKKKRQNKSCFHALI